MRALLALLLLHALPGCLMIAGGAVAAQVPDRHDALLAWPIGEPPAPRGKADIVDAPPDGYVKGGVLCFRTDGDRSDKRRHSRMEVATAAGKKGGERVQILHMNERKSQLEVVAVYWRRGPAPDGATCEGADLDACEGVREACR